MMTYSVGDKILHPMYGAGVVKDITERDVSGETRSYYELKILSGGTIVNIPVANGGDESGVRRVIDAPAAEEFLNSLPDIEIEMTQNWNRRYRENMTRIRSGDISEVAKVVKILMSREKERGLSTGERKMLQSAKLILVSEIALSRDSAYDETERRVNSALAY